jgi:hypothetical protein
MIKVDKSTAFDILNAMIEQIGAVAILEELSQQLSGDELCGIVSGLDEYLFDGHYTELIDEGEFD